LMGVDGRGEKIKLQDWIWRSSKKNPKELIIKEIRKELEN
jgi:hypothetical protein